MSPTFAGCRKNRPTKEPGASSPCTYPNCCPDCRIKTRLAPGHVRTLGRLLAGPPIRTGGGHHHGLRRLCPGRVLTAVAATVTRPYVVTLRYLAWNGSTRPPTPAPSAGAAVTA